MSRICVVMPRYLEDVYTRKRTIFHSLDGMWDIGCKLCLTQKKGSTIGMTATITSIREVFLHELPDTDLKKLGTDVTKNAYFDRWNKLFPESPVSGALRVFRVEFYYDPDKLSASSLKIDD